MLKRTFEILRVVVTIALVVVACVYAGIKLMKIQIVDGEMYLSMSRSSTSAEKTVYAARGEIVDRNGVELVENEVSYNVIIEYSFFPSDYETQNEIILRVAEILSEDGLEWIDDTPITFSTPYKFSDDASDSEISKIKEELRLNSYATAENCIDRLIENYEISDDYTEEEKRIIAGVRYMMLIGDFSTSIDYTFITGVPIETVSKIRELSGDLNGIDILESYERVYIQGDVAPHIVGYVGPVYAEEYAELKTEGYLISDTIGKSGIEKALESVLRGTNGTNIVTVDSDGVVTESVSEEVEPGNTVMLTIDSELQQACQEILDNHISYLRDGILTKTDSSTNQELDFSDCEAGAIVVLDVKTGAVLAAATSPTYDINDLLEDYNSVLNADGSPLYNRAFDGLYRPGSVMKTVTATAALAEGIIDITTKYTCNRRYNYLDITVNCTGSHGSINVVTAIQKSCNIFFYQVIQEVGLDLFLEYETAYGLGEDPGLEISASSGYLASPDTFANLGLDWTSGQLLQAAIGQSEVAVTPLQMAGIALTIANGGVRYSPYLVDSIWDYNMTECLEKTEPEIAYIIDADYDEVFAPIVEGMILAGESTTSATYYASNETNAFLAQFSTDALPDKVAIKTGTPQASNTATQNSTVIGFYPADDPEIAFAVVIENGEYAKYTVRKIIEAYYGWTTEEVELENGMMESVIVTE
ncbi:MAG: hypothetical protein LUG49_03605 [Oscillospiraceae bacterium]|nr:hypothetical protein [Oscillospiraceae bacterium]